MAWALVGRGQLGRDRPDGGRVPQARAGRDAASARKGGSTTPRRRVIDTAGRIVDADDRRGAGRRATGVYVAAGRVPQARAARAATGSAPETPEPTWPSTPAAGLTSTRPTPRTLPVTRASTSGPAPSPSSPRARPPPRPSAPASPTTLGDPDAFATALTRRPSSARRPGVPRRPASGRPRHRPGPRRPLAARWRRSPAASARRPRGDRATPLLFVADRLFREPELEAALVRVRAARAHPRRPTPSGPGSSSAGRPASPDDWITVDSLAHPYGKGIAAEPYRWAELEQLVYSPVALGAPPRRLHDRDDDPRRPHARPRARGRRRTPCRCSEQLMGDAEPDVQKALSWAYRSLAVVDHAATVAALRDETGPRRRERTTAIARGSSATPSPSSIRRRRRRPRDRLDRHPQAPGRPVHLGRRGRPPPASAACPIPIYPP